MSSSERECENVMTSSLLDKIECTLLFIYITSAVDIIHDAISRRDHIREPISAIVYLLDLYV